MRLLAREFRVWSAFWSFVRMRPLGAHEFSYGASMRPMLVTVIAVLAVEGVAVEAVVGLIFGHGWWLWVLAGVHVYAICWFAAIVASLRTMPHVIRASSIRLRDCVFGELVLPRVWVTDARVVRTANTGRSGLVADADSRSARLCHGDGTVILSLGACAVIAGVAVRDLAVSVDRPVEFVAAYTQAAS